MAVFAAVLFINFSNSNKEGFFVVMNSDLEPMLPATPFEYSNVKVPNHLLAADDTINAGYGAIGVDSLAFIGIDDEVATLGRVLFYDKKLSAHENISCGSCHDQKHSFAENKQFGEGVNSDTKRNSMHLNDLAWTDNEFFLWDMRETDLHEMIVLPLKDENEIGANIEEVKFKLEQTTYYPDLFNRAYGSATITEDRIVDALVQFIHSMNTFNSKFDQAAADNFETFTELEIYGRDVFSSACNICHSQGKSFFFDPNHPMEGEERILTFPFVFNNGLPIDDTDKGVGSWLQGMDGLFKVPSLRNIELTGPYMHDGRFKTLEEVVDHYSEGVVESEWSLFVPIGGFQFIEEDKQALIAFLKTLTDKSFLENEKWSDPFQTTTNIPSTPSFESLVIQPNPMRTSALIEFENVKNELVYIKVFDGTGKLMQQDQIRSNRYELRKSDFAPGMYFVEMLMGTQKSTHKLMVQ